MLSEFSRVRSMLRASVLVCALVSLGALACTEGGATEDGATNAPPATGGGAAGGPPSATSDASSGASTGGTPPGSGAHSGGDGGLVEGGRATATDGSSPTNGAAGGDAASGATAGTVGSDASPGDTGGASAGGVGGDLPLVYPTENTGADCAAPPMPPAFSALPAVPNLPDLGSQAGSVSMRAAAEVYKALGIPDRIGFTQAAASGHCAFPGAQTADVAAFVDKFLLGKASTNTTIAKTPYTTDLTKWVTWTTPQLK